MGSSIQARITTYASTPLEKLDDGQRRAVKSLASLEAVQKELEEVKKAIEVRVIYLISLAKLIRFVRLTSWNKCKS